MNFLFATGYQLQIASWLGVDPCDLLVRKARMLQWHPQQMQKETVTKMRDISCRGGRDFATKPFYPKTMKRFSSHSYFKPHIHHSAQTDEQGTKLRPRYF